MKCRFLIFLLCMSPLGAYSQTSSSPQQPVGGSESVTGLPISYTRHTVYAGVNGSVIGDKKSVGAFAGIYLNSFNIEGGYLMPLSAKTKVWWISDPSLWDGQQGLEYEYSLSSIINANIGYGVLLGSHIRFTPQVGLFINNIKGTYTGSESGMDEQTFVLSGRAGVRLEYSPKPFMGLVCMPAYDTHLMMGAVASQLDSRSSLIKDWCAGFSLIVGIELFF